MTDGNGNGNAGEHGMPRKVAIICSKGSLDMAYPGLILANAALQNPILAEIIGYGATSDASASSVNGRPVGSIRSR